MARKPRIQYEGAVYHVMSRGDRGGKIYKDRLDYDLFLMATAEACQRTGWRIHAFVLLPNHFHWLLETPEANLVDGMKWFLGAYSQRYNSRHGQIGHVFQGRYKAVVIQSDSGNYFETVSTYIHLNPARARLVNREKGGLEQYEWSSYPWYLKGKGKRPEWLEVKRVLGNLSLKDDAGGHRRYTSYIDGRIGELRKKEGRKAFKQEWASLRYGWYAGSDVFRESLVRRLKKVVEGRQRGSYCGEGIRRHDQTEAEKLIKKGMKALGVSEHDLSCLPKGHELKCLLAWLAHSKATVSHAWLSNRLNMGCPATLSAYIRRVRQADSQSLARLKKRLENA
jgi:putative transposase